MATILLSIKPEYVERIFNGSKKYEFRKCLPQKSVEKIVIYSTDPVQQVVGEVEVLGTLTMKPTSLWEATKGASGISWTKYKAYFKGRKAAYAFQLGQVQLYEFPKTLEELGVKNAPQSFVYLNKD